MEKQKGNMAMALRMMGNLPYWPESLAFPRGALPLMRASLLLRDFANVHRHYPKQPLMVKEAKRDGQTTVNITDEVITGGLSTLMLRLWFDRDEKGHRRVPIFLHRLRIRISDSYHPTEEKRTAFRIECEYANGAARWVIYRQLRDFVSLHTHYTVSNVYNRLGDELPEFPLTSIPYLKFLKKEDANIDQASFARLQREALETYLIKLMRAVMFHPSSNRLSGFLEVSALSISLAHSGGVQYKGGYLQMQAVNNGTGGFGRKGLGRRVRKELRWSSVRESYLVVVNEPGELTVWDVFMFDPDFRIEQPKRYYRQGLNNILYNAPAMIEHPISSLNKHQGSEIPTSRQQHLSPQRNGDRGDSDNHSLLGSVKSRISRVFHLKTERSHEGMQSSDHRAKSQREHNVDHPVDPTSMPPRSWTPMLDPSTNPNPLSVPENLQSPNADGQAVGEGKNNEEVSKHTFYIVNSQTKLKLFARNERQMLQWITALEKSASSSTYTNENRFDSFAPIRLNVAAQWLVDGRDYFWNLSRAILMAREIIQIHDWWLSPELFLRRPNMDRYRLDRLLERKAKEGVKIYVILYQEVSNRTTPTDSHYAKQRLQGLHHNIMVQRSPSHFQTGTLYWAHHEKLCVIDQTIAFMGGIDLCFGRWDTPQHVLVDDVEGTDRPEIWPGKDYSNPRILDFYNLHKPDEDMYDRTTSPRMPWHDVGLQVVGQPARDLARHFVQRYFYLLPINHTRVMPFLLPPPEFKPTELAEMGLTGTCEMQICRSAGPWSMGTQSKIEHSIQNAYLKAIQMSEHFVYIENQFFITSTVVNGVKIENNIGDAIVHRIIKAHRDSTPWKCCIVIPLLPGFTFPVDHSDASAIRIILECQNRTITQGPTSMFSRLRNEGINPEDYISVFSLRNWAKLRGEVLTTEQVYIHGKVCIVDDRVAIIGSANINERSQRGDRDSELAAVIRDTDMIDGEMAGRPFKVGRFAHSLRVRLMREHLGIDVDALDGDDNVGQDSVHLEQTMPRDPEQNQDHDGGDVREDIPLSVANGLQTDQNHQPDSHSVRADALEQERKDDILKAKERTSSGGLEQVPAENRPSSQVDATAGGETTPTSRGTYEDSIDCELSDNPKLEDHDPSTSTTANEEHESVATRSTIRKRRPSKLTTKWNVSIKRPQVGPDDFEDPISDGFWKDMWVTSAAYNTEIYRKVFHAIPDDTVTTWKQYKEFVMHHERLARPCPESGEPTARMPSETREDFLPNVSNGMATTNTPIKDGISEGSHENGGTKQPLRQTSSPDDEPVHKATGRCDHFERWEREEMARLLGELNGHLVVYPTKFLEGEDSANNFLFNADRLLPLPIYD
ncbi:hypothetical protein AGABI2DRAFT_186563 [Agaricus bisporus var. bisporus H97]|uniref:hypothetical protein n=1 Tax=Agaricus bisporus var. bisporus (strain H97 / ATCC MYA-4626 / FGSC 10389) TaxID=936046 RepID=UPI00029F5C1B|nr:hypothetical protein AGABI2DRAFT_186563 [Agaricus bisporus var. bisporus H97]EKV45864.1 hypothetical protein AGABI2DRAFT_186563 [Agaricus bisporus var. bisporus H97]